MVKLLSNLHHSFPCTSYITFILVSHSCLLIDPVEQECEELPEPAPIEDTNPEQDQGKPRCILPYSLRFIYLLSYFMILDCVLDYRSCIEALVA
jgi:hypothetical protein